MKRIALIAGALLALLILSLLALPFLIGPFDVEHNLRRNSGRIHQGAIRIGSAPANLTGTCATGGDDTVAKMNLDGPNLPVPELASLLPALGVVLPNGSSLEGAWQVRRPTQCSAPT